MSLPMYDKDKQLEELCVSEQGTILLLLLLCGRWCYVESGSCLMLLVAGNLEKRRRELSILDAVLENEADLVVARRGLRNDVGRTARDAAVHGEDGRLGRRNGLEVRLAATCQLGL